ncbi:DUF3575 domain-containing protein [Flavobacterium qiangtangense]|uniref:DUF3575 domain-containing protein n=1 Tax=Flavobacterium qiangtangense TaxID=1442595 RepID=A0ABW1PJ78_9FLAO
MKKFFALTFLFFTTFIFGQTTIKFNGATALIGVPNVGFETSIGRKLTFQFDAAASFWESINGAPYKGLMITPEVRYHFKEKFDGFYVGANISFATYKLQKYGYSETGNYQKGFSFFIGPTIGYQWKLNENWGLDLFVGGGHQEANYKLYNIETNKRVDTWYKGYNRSGEFIPYRGGLMITYKLK